MSEVKIGNLVVFDNYDSFTYNLVHYLENLTGQSPKVVLNDDPNWERCLTADALLISPGPGLPLESGALMSLLHAWESTKPLLGICLGMQAMGQIAGENLIRLPKPVHGTAHPVYSNSAEPIFEGVDSVFHAGRYHSWGFFELVSEQYRAIASSSDGCIMAIKHVKNPWYGLQFHPESIMTTAGKRLIHNWLNLAGIKNSYSLS